MYKAKVSFSGVVSMNAGEVKDIADDSIAKDLVRAGYIEPVQPANKVKTDKAKTEKKPTRAKTKRG